MLGLTLPGDRCQTGGLVADGVWCEIRLGFDT